MLAALPRSSFQNWCRTNGLPYRSRLFWSDVQPGSVRETSPPRTRLDPFGSFLRKRNRGEKHSISNRRRSAVAGNARALAAPLDRTTPGQRPPRARRMTVSHCQLRNCFSCAGCQVLRSFLRRTSIPVSASPGRATAEPPSGTVRPFAENENIVPVPPPAFWLVKLHSVLVGSNPGDSFFLS
jgi:hypothetical protein